LSHYNQAKNVHLKAAQLELSISQIVFVVIDFQWLKTIHEAKSVLCQCYVQYESEVILLSDSPHLIVQEIKRVCQKMSKTE